MVTVFSYAGLAMLVLAGMAEMNDDVGLAKILVVFGVGGLLAGYVTTLIDKVGINDAVHGLIVLAFQLIAGILCFISIALFVRGDWIEGLAGSLIFIVLAKIVRVIDPIEVEKEMNAR